MIISWKAPVEGLAEQEGLELTLDPVAEIPWTFSQYFYFYVSFYA